MIKTIALVEDEGSIRENYADALRRQGYRVQAFSNRREAIQSFRASLPDLVLIDIGLGDETEGGFDLCRELRSLSLSVPIIFLTARNSDLDTISGLRLGADDYLTKNVTLSQLMARIAALFRRIEALSDSLVDEKIISRGNLTIDINRLLIQWQNERVDLTLTEFWIVHSLALRVGHVKSREQLMKDAEIFVDEDTITSHIKRIRKKFCEIDKDFNHIETIYGMGYRWN